MRPSFTILKAMSLRNFWLAHAVRAVCSANCWMPFSAMVAAASVAAAATNSMAMGAAMIAPTASTAMLATLMKQAFSGVTKSEGPMPVCPGVMACSAAAASFRSSATPSSLPPFSCAAAR